jgi:DNA replication and repair protein RecF
VYLEHLNMRRFRLVDQASLSISKPFVVFQGNNGQGKTTFLEALYMACTGRSFRQVPSAQCIQYGQPESCVEAVFVRQGVRHEVAVKITPKGRQLRLDGRGLNRLGALVGVMNAVAFFPDDLRIIKGSPEDRRTFIDRAVSHFDPDFLEHVLAYEKVLRARNVLLRGVSTPDKTWLQTYNAQLVEHGTAIERARARLLEKTLPYAQAYYASLMQAHPSDVGMFWHTGLPLEVSHPDFALAYTEALEKAYAKDRACGWTSIGAHRADLMCTLREKPARYDASQGQQRAMVLALKLAEVHVLKNQLQVAPLVLLDDVSSELDAFRTQALFESLGLLGAHIWLTTTGTAPLPYPSHTQFFRVQQGTCTPVENR